MHTYSTSVESWQCNVMHTYSTSVVSWECNVVHTYSTSVAIWRCSLMPVKPVKATLQEAFGHITHQSGGGITFCL